MAYREDKDLEFLAEMESRDLNDLVYCLIYDTDGKERITEELSKSESYKKYVPDHQKYWQEIAAEIQTFGANSFATMARGGKGVLYREVLSDVAEKMKVKFDKNVSTADLESALLEKILETGASKLDSKDLQKLANKIGISSATSLSKEALLAAFITAFRSGGIQSYQLASIIIDSALTAILGRGLAVAGSSLLARTVSFLTGPIGWAIIGAWTAIDFAGPAYRVTIPAVLNIAWLRRQDELEKKHLLTEYQRELERYKREESDLTSQ
ncbi:DUF3944 domain-containing protein [Neisseria sp. 23W00296]|uniref:DUF3944 domain-containing protein n=1 Tax=unclassified Neisseria TaxID=2623750 RepID=UPI0002A35EBF|nr:MULTISPECIES: DUF3944 domain-containing protein [unclassified Neisseria]ASP17103.1 DUF3944 domain-containing protein [Neisseria sp. KEM232]EKY04225.1 hypothetical protein HMPREF9120_02360 [Neisseria sp. oral taxon 020 str. F0370]